MKECPTICATCVQIHGRDTNAPIACGVCHAIIGCFWHNKNHQHIRACEQRQRARQASNTIEKGRQ